MASFTTTPNMSLPVPVVGVELGPQYAIDINNCMGLLDVHDHSLGRGVQINQAGINITGDLPLNSNNLTAIRSSRYSSNANPLALSTDLDCVYVVVNDLYYNDGLGNQIRLTQSGGIAGTPGSISGLVNPASATYIPSSQTFVWQSGVNIAANMDMASIIIRPQTLSANGITIAAPSALGSNFTLTLPSALPASTLPTFLSSGGTLSTGLVTPTVMSSNGAAGGAFLQSNGSNGQAYVSLPSVNLLGNPEFRFYQRQDPNTLIIRGDAAYGPDRWKVMNSGSSATMKVARVSDPTASFPSPYAGQFLQADASATQYGPLQIIESQNCISFRNKTVTFSFVVRTDSTQVTAVRAGIIEWTGTADSVTSDLVATWGATPTLVANAAFRNTPADLSVSSSYAQYNITVSLGASFNNLALFIWTPNAEVLNDNFYLKQCQLVYGSFPLDWPTVGMSYAQDLLFCQRYCEKTYDTDVNPGTITNVGAIIGAGDAGGNPRLSFIYKASKFKTPNVSYFNPVTGTSGQIRIGSTNLTGSNFSNGLSSVGLGGSGTGSAGGGIEAHVIVEAEL